MYFLKKAVRLFMGLFLFALGIVLTIHAHLGLQPWDVLHQGLGRVFHVSIGTATVIVSLIIVLLNGAFGEKVGLSTIANALFVGTFVNVIQWLHVVPDGSSLFLRGALLLAGVCAVAVATYLYLSVGYGAGPRDGLMVALTKKIKKPVGLIRFSLEGSALVIGFFLGGKVGIGTFFSALFIGPLVQSVFHAMHYDVHTVTHRYLGREQFRWLWPVRVRRPTDACNGAALKQKGN
ncbi:MAG: hypothetical protein ABF868_12175 [Sporolactobacillus sp.]